MARLIMFAILAVVILGSAIFCVTTKRIMRAAAALLFVLFGVAGLYFVLGYTFLGATQISIYAGGVTMMFIFAIQLVDKQTLQGLKENWICKRTVLACAISFVGFCTVVLTLLKHNFFNVAMAREDALSQEMSVKQLGESLMGAGKFGYVLPFEFISLFLLACIIGGLVILNINSKKEEGEK
jgi:NADH-quinone oxidoreductase subunit J